MFRLTFCFPIKRIFLLEDAVRCFLQTASSWCEDSSRMLLVKGAEEENNIFCCVFSIQLPQKEKQIFGFSHKGYLADYRKRHKNLITRGRIAAVSFISRFIIVVQTWAQQHLKTCRCSHGLIGSKVFCSYLFIYLFAGLDFWGQWSTKLLCKYILFTTWQIYRLHRN